MRCGDDDTDKRIDLPAELKKDLGKRNYYDAVVFTHLDDDHICRSSEFFQLDHATKYQGEGRIKITEMWVPAAVITEEGCTDESRIIQAEARYRLKLKAGVRVFSRPERLKDWFEKNGLKLDDVRHLIIDAGQLVPTFSLASDGVEFFVHSPFAKRMNDAEIEDRNQDSIVVQAVFEIDGVKTKAIFAADCTHECWTEIVNITKYHKRVERLEWDIMKLAHHCSYKSIGPERSTKASPDKTIPVAEAKFLYEEKGLEHCRIVSTSWPIPTIGSDDDKS
ncbi:MAG TPA: hypothetical protein VG722_06975, partial [Tepidisphaeraceae bacterium]|nr:hypothetical protein [Tepidisphaeraceae bacterium]